MLLSAEDNVVSTASKARRVLLYMKRPFAALTQTEFLSGHILNMLVKHPPPSYLATQRHLERVQKIAVKFVNGL